MKYYCYECEEIVDEDDMLYHKESISTHIGNKSVYELDGCKCGSDNFEDVDEIEYIQCIKCDVECKLKVIGDLSDMLEANCPFGDEANFKGVKS